LPAFKHPSADSVQPSTVVPDTVENPIDVAVLDLSSLAPRRKPMRISAEALAAVEAMGPGPDARIGAELAMRFPRGSGM
jgi:hypothetical protein